MIEDKQHKLQITMKSGREYSFMVSNTELDWLYDRLFGRSDETFQNFSSDEIINVSEIEYLKHEEVADDTGQEIFEGDLLDMSDPTENIIFSGNTILEVCFDGLEFTVKGDIENGEMSFREFKEICELAGIHLKVIGNVYENPDLLEVSS